MRRVCRRLICLFVAPFACLSLSVVAGAANVGVRYVVEAKALRKEAVVGTSLTFALFSDSTCTTEIFTSDVAIEAVDRISLVKSMRPKKAPKPPKTAELEHVLTGVAPAPEMYLMVSGTGVTPIGTACQPQSAAGLAAWSHGNGLGNGSTIQPYECVGFNGGQIDDALLNDVVVVSHATMPEYIRVWAELAPQSGGLPPRLTWHVCNDSSSPRVIPGGIAATAYGLRP